MASVRPPGNLYSMGEKIIVVSSAVFFISGQSSSAVKTSALPVIVSCAHARTLYSGSLSSISLLCVRRASEKTFDSSEYLLLSNIAIDEKAEKNAIYLLNTTN